MPTAQDSALTLRQGRADVLFNSTPGAVQLLDKLLYAVAGPEFEATTRIGMAVRKGDAAMKAALEAALKEIVADGSYKILIETWKFPCQWRCSTDGDLPCRSTLFSTTSLRRSSCAERR